MLYDRLEVIRTICVCLLSVHQKHNMCQNIWPYIRQNNSEYSKVSNVHTISYPSVWCNIKPSVSMIFQFILHCTKMIHSSAIPINNTAT